MIKVGAVVINNDTWQPEEDAPPFIYSLVLWPKGKHRTTMLHPDEVFGKRLTNLT